MDCNIFTKT